MPEERSRPSLMGPAAGPLLCVAVQAFDSVGTKKDRDILISAVEKGVQNEMDEQLRILNEKEIVDRSLRDMIIKVRDDSYDALASQGKDEDTLDEEQKSKLY